MDGNKPLQAWIPCRSRIMADTTYGISFCTCSPTSAISANNHRYIKALNAPMTNIKIKPRMVPRRPPFTFGVSFGPPSIYAPLNFFQHVTAQCWQRN